MRSKGASSTPPRGGKTMKKSLLSEYTVEVGRRYKGGIIPNTCMVCISPWMTDHEVL